MQRMILGILWAGLAFFLLWLPGVPRTIAATFLLSMNALFGTFLFLWGLSDFSQKKGRDEKTIDR